MVLCVVVILGPLWIHGLVHACSGEELPKEVVVSCFRERVLESLGLEKPPQKKMRGPRGSGANSGANWETWHMITRGPGSKREPLDQNQPDPEKETSEMILLPSSDSSCSTVDSVTRESGTWLTFHFQPSSTIVSNVVTSARFWFFMGEGSSTNSSATLFLLTSAQQLRQAAGAPSRPGSDGWTTYFLDQEMLVSVSEGPFWLQVSCTGCRCEASEPENSPFLHVHVHRGGHARSPREAAVTVPWSLSAIYRLQRPSQERPADGDCQRGGVEISFEELGWDNWIVHPKTVTFYYCHGNCSGADRTTAMLGMSQCCAPVHGSMRSLKVTTTSDGGYSFKLETLPNIIPEECACI
uniref:Inhibin alpha chain n=1 Tax=Oryzias latipes TaxID=8090 RepID=A0A3P9MR19_ORYLA